MRSLLAQNVVITICLIDIVFIRVETHKFRLILLLLLLLLIHQACSRRILLQHLHLNTWLLQWCQCSQTLRVLLLLIRSHPLFITKMTTAHSLLPLISGAWSFYRSWFCLIFAKIVCSLTVSIGLCVLPHLRGQLDLIFDWIFVIFLENFFFGFLR